MSAPLTAVLWLRLLSSAGGGWLLLVQVMELLEELNLSKDDWDSLLMEFGLGANKIDKRIEGKVRRPPPARAAVPALPAQLSSWSPRAGAALVHSYVHALKTRRAGLSPEIRKLASHVAVVAVGGSWS